MVFDGRSTIMLSNLCVWGLDNFGNLRRFTVKRYMSVHMTYGFLKFYWLNRIIIMLILNMHYLFLKNGELDFICRFVLLTLT